MERLSILIANRNTLACLKLCLKSLRENLSRTDHYILIVDDASTDGSAEWLEENRGRYGCEIEFHKGPERLGIVGAYNRLVDAAETEAVFIVHSDMYFARGADEETARYLAPATVCTCTRIEPPLWPATKRTIVADLGFVPEEFREQEFLRLAAERAQPGKYTDGIFALVMCFKEDFLAVGGLDPVFAPQSREDSDLFNRMAVAGYRFRQSWSAFCYHFSGRGSRKKDRIDKDSAEWQISNRKNERNFIRRWGCGVRHDEMLKPIVPPKEPVSLATLLDADDVGNIVPFLTDAEPYFDEILFVCDGPQPEGIRMIEEYVKREQEAGPTLLRREKIEICERRPIGNLAAQLNFVLEQCGSEWVLVAFPDERFDADLLERLQDIIRMMRGTGKTVCGFPRLDYVDGVPVDERRREEWTGERLARAARGEPRALRDLDPHFRLVRRGVRYRGDADGLPDPVGRRPAEVMFWPQAAIRGPKRRPVRSADLPVRRMAIDARTVEPHMRGIGLYAHRLVRHAAALAPETEFLVLHSAEGRPLFEGFPANVHLVECPVKLGDPRWERELGERWCVENGVSLYHGTSYECVLSDRIATLATVHDVSFITFPQFYSLQFIRRMSAQLQVTLRSADHIVTVSQHVKDKLSALWDVSAEKVTAVHSGPGQFEEPVYPSGPREHVLAMDLAQPRKNAEGVIRAFAEVAGNGGFGGSLKLVGPGWEVRPGLREECERLGILDRVEVTGEVDAEGLAKLYSGATCLTYPSFDEGFGFPPLEAMQFGTPVVVSTAGSLPEVCGDAALYVDPQDPGQIADAIEKLLRDPDLCSEMARRGRNRAREFSWQKCAAETLRLYRETSEKKRKQEIFALRPRERADLSATVGMVTTWNVPCGVAESTRPLVESLRSNYTVLVLGEQREGEPETDEVFAWRRGASLDGIREEAMRQRCGVVHFQYHPAFFYDGTAFCELLWDLKLAGIPTVVTLHEISDSPPLWRLMPDLLIAHSRSTREMLLRSRTTTPCSLIPMPLSEPQGEKVFGREGKFVLKTVGFLHPNKRHAWGLQVLAALKNDFDVEYYVVGAPAKGCESYPEELGKLARDLGVEGRFDLRVEYVPPEDLLAEWRSADVGLLPYEYVGMGSSGAVLDALSAGIPVVTSRSVFFDDLEGAVARAQSPEEMAEKVRRILSDAGERERMAASRKKLAADRAPKLRAERHERAYEQVLARARRVRRRALKPWISLHILAKEDSILGLELYRSALQSLKGYPDEFVIVDNGSSPEVLAMVAEELRGCAVKTISAPEVTDFSVLRNIALENSSREATHFHWVDTDEVFFPSELPRLREALRDPDISAMHVLLVHFMIEPTFIQDIQVNRCIFRIGRGMRWTKSVHEVLEGLPPGRESFMPVRFLHFGYIRPQWETFLKWLKYDKLEYGNLDRYRWEGEGERRRPWFGDRRTPDTIVEERKRARYEGVYPASCARWLEAWKQSGLPWREYLKQLVDHRPWELWQELRRKKGTWEATLDEILAVTEGREATE